MLQKPEVLQCQFDQDKKDWIHNTFDFVWIGDAYPVLWQIAFWFFVFSKTKYHFVFLVALGLTRVDQICLEFVTTACVVVEVIGHLAQLLCFVILDLEAS